MDFYQNLMGLQVSFDTAYSGENLVTKFLGYKHQGVVLACWLYGTSVRLLVKTHDNLLIQVNSNNVTLIN